MFASQRVYVCMSVSLRKKESASIHINFYYFHWGLSALLPHTHTPFTGRKKATQKWFLLFSLRRKEIEGITLNKLSPYTTMILRWVLCVWVCVSFKSVRIFSPLAFVWYFLRLLFLCRRLIRAIFEYNLLGVWKCTMKSMCIEYRISAHLFAANVNESQSCLQ